MKVHKLEGQRLEVVAQLGEIFLFHDRPQIACTIHKISDHHTCIVQLRSIEAPLQSHRLD
jgi:hypothetical protein